MRGHICCLIVLSHKIFGMILSGIGVVIQKKLSCFLYKIHCIIVGVFGNGNDFLNYCILVGKSVIYHCKRNNVKPSLQSFKLLLSKKYHTELYIVQKNNILHIFHKKWKFKPLTH